MRPRFAVAHGVLALAALALSAAPALARHAPSTYSIVAFDSLTGELGVAVQSKYFSVGRVVPWAEGGVGAVATQANVNPSFGMQALAMLRSGLSPDQVMQALAATDSLWPARQLALVDARGRVATWTGPRCMDWAGGEAGAGFAVQGNILAGPEVVAEMARGFRAAKGELAERLIAAMEAGQAAGGDKRGMQSAALLVVRPSERHPEYGQRYVDLRVEDHKNPIQELRRVWHIHQGFHGAGAHLDFAREYEARGQTALARLERERVAETLRGALARNERDASLLNGLAWSCAIHGLELDGARRAAERAAALEPRNVDILDTLAEVHFRQGDHAKAVAVGTRAVQIDPKSQYLKDQLDKYRRGSVAGR